MMKKIFIGVITLSLLFVSCAKDYSSIVVGKFSQTSLSENELKNNSEDEEPFAICDSKKVSSIQLDEDRSYIFKISQSLEDVSFFGEASFTLEDLMTYFNQEITIYGKYSLKGNKLVIENEKVVLADGTEFSFEEYQAADASIGAKIQTVKFEVNEDELTLFYGKESITYFRNK